MSAMRVVVLIGILLFQTVSLALTPEEEASVQKELIQGFASTNFSWGFDDEALFVAKARKAGSDPTQVTIKGQACSGSICKNVTVTVPLDAAGAGEKINSTGLVPLVSAR